MLTVSYFMHLFRWLLEEASLQVDVKMRVSKEVLTFGTLKIKYNVRSINLILKRRLYVQLVLFAVSNGLMGNSRVKRRNSTTHKRRHILNFWREATDFKKICHVCSLTQSIKG